MPRARATCRASSAASVPQQLPKRFVGSAGSDQGQTRMVTPTTSQPCATRHAAATEESTPPLIPTTIRSAIYRLPSQQTAEPFELVGGRVRDLDAPLAIGADDRHTRHERPLQCGLERAELHRARASL